MRVLLLGGTGNLGSRLIPALVAHGHHVTAYVRTIDKLRAKISPELFDLIETYQGDALDTAAVQDALQKHDCDAVVNTAGNFNNRPGLNRYSAALRNPFRPLRYGQDKIVASLFAHGS